MNNGITRCSGVEHLLIDYSDGTLGEAEAAAVRRHVDHCEACEHKVALLKRSLGLAHTVWLESAASAPAVSPAILRDNSRRRHWLPLAWAACGAAAVAVLCWNLLTLGPDVAHKAVPTADTTSKRVILHADFEAFLIREEQSARLAMSIHILANAPSTGEDLKRAEAYLRVAYGPDSDR